MQGSVKLHFSSFFNDFIRIVIVNRFIIIIIIIIITIIIITITLFFENNIVYIYFYSPFNY